MFKLFSTLLRFARSEQMGLAVLFLLVLAVIIVPRFMLPPEPPPFAFTELQRQIDSAVSVGSEPPVRYNNNRNYGERTGNRPRSSYAKANVPPPVDTVRGRITYKPYVRPEAPPIIIDLNRADTTQLQQVRGIGSYYARRIVEYRERLGGYVDIGQLLEIRGVDEERVLRWQNELKLDTAAVRKINLLTGSEEILRKHPYIGYYAARGIMNFRKSSATVTLDELVKNHVLGEDEAGRLKGYVEEE